MPDPLVELLAHAGVDAIVRLEVWPGGIGNAPPPIEYLRPASTIHADPVEDVPVPPRETAVMWTPPGSSVSIRDAAGLTANKFATAPEKTAIKFYLDTATNKDGHTWVQVLTPDVWLGKWVARDVLTDVDPGPVTPPVRVTKQMWTPAGSQVNIRRTAGLDGEVLATAPPKMPIVFFVDQQINKDGHLWAQIDYAPHLPMPVIWGGNWVAVDVLSATDPN